MTQLLFGLTAFGFLAQACANFGWNTRGAGIVLFSVFSCMVLVQIYGQIVAARRPLPLVVGPARNFQPTKAVYTGPAERRNVVVGWLTPRTAREVESTIVATTTGPVSSPDTLSSRTQGAPSGAMQLLSPTLPNRTFSSSSSNLVSPVSDPAPKELISQPKRQLSTPGVTVAPPEPSAYRRSTIFFPPVPLPSPVVAPFDARRPSVPLYLEQVVTPTTSIFSPMGPTPDPPPNFPFSRTATPPSLTDHRSVQPQPIIVVSPPPTLDTRAI